jgi:hypothetical protein
MLPHPVQNTCMLGQLSHSPCIELYPKKPSMPPWSSCVSCWKKFSNLHHHCGSEVRFSLLLYPNMAGYVLYSSQHLICKHVLGLRGSVAQASLLDELGLQTFQIIWLKACVKFFALLVLLPEAIRCYGRQCEQMWSCQRTVTRLGVHG